MERDVKRTMKETTSDMEMTEVVDASNGDDVIGDLLSFARQLIHHGKPSQALHAVVMAMRAKGGEQAVLYVLERARELYRTKLQASSEADELASLFAECAISEAQPGTSINAQSRSSLLSQSLTPPTASPNGVDSDVYGKSILAEFGRGQIMVDAFSDGSSFICLQCGGLVSQLRKDEHYAYWCQF